MALASPAIRTAAPAVYAARLDNGRAPGAAMRGLPMRSMSMIVFAVLAGSALLARSAGAETKSWAAVKGKLPATASVVVGIDVKAVRGLSAFPSLLSSLFSESKDLKETVELVKATCGLDLPSVISDVTVVVNEQEKGAIVIGLDGVDQAKLVGCADKVIQKSDPKLKLSTKPGKVTEYSLSGQSDKLFAAWLANDVVAISTDARSRDLLDAVLAGKPASGDLAGYLKGANTAALVWGAFSLNKEGFKGGSGAITNAKGTLAISAKLTATAPDVAKKMVAEAKQELARKTKSAEQSAPKVAKVLKAVTIVERGGADFAVDAAVPVAELPQLLPAFDKVF
jgi:hypothetical protein